MNMMPKLNQVNVKVLANRLNQPILTAFNKEHYYLTEKDYQYAKQYLIARGEWLFVYKNATDKQKIIEKANIFIKEDDATVP